MAKKTVNSHIDESVKIPSVVLAAAAKSQELHEAVYPSDSPAPVDTDQAAPPEADAPADPAIVSPTTVSPVAPPAEIVVQAHPAPTPQPDTSWEHKYNSMKGRYERSETTIKHLTDRIAGMEATIASMAVAAPATVEPSAPKSLVTTKDVEDFGEDFLDVIGRKAKETVSPEVAELKAQVASLTQRLENVGAYVGQDARSRMHDQLNTRCPNWKEINESEKFLNWLALPDAYSGAIRHQLLKAAYTANDAPRVLAFFNGFLAEEAASTPTTPVPDTSTKIPLEELAAPGRARTAAAAAIAPAEKPTFTRAQITSFYRDVANGKYAGRDDDKNRLEQQINDAAREGRIR